MSSKSELRDSQEILFLWPGLKRCCYISNSECLSLPFVRIVIWTTVGVENSFSFSSYKSNQIWESEREEEDPFWSELEWIRIHNYFNGKLWNSKTSENNKLDLRAVSDTFPTLSRHLCCLSFLYKYRTTIFWSHHLSIPTEKRTIKFVSVKHFNLASLLITSSQESHTWHKIVYWFM